MAKERLSYRRRSHGVTLVEMIISLALLSVLACAAIPSFTRLLARERLTAAQTDLIISLSHAREQANRSGRRTIVCPSPNGQRCEATSRWESGWIAGYAERDASQIQGDPWHIRSGHPDLHIVSSQGRRSVVFRAIGRASGSNVGILICDRKRAELALQVFVSNAGRIRGARAHAEGIEACRSGETF